MKVLSLLQPWASLYVKGDKRVETRSWNTSFRGDVLIHASLKRTDAIQLAMVEPFYGCIGGLRGAYELPVGAIIGQVTITETFRFGSDRAIEYLKSLTKEQAFKEVQFGDWNEGRYGFLSINPITFKNPIPCKGNLSLWNLPAELQATVTEQITISAVTSSLPT